MVAVFNRVVLSANKISKMGKGAPPFEPEVQNTNILMNPMMAIFFIAMIVF